MKDKHPYETLLVIAAGCVVGFFLTSSRYFLWSALIIIIGGLFSRGVANAIHKGWYMIAEALGYVMNRIVLAFIFYIILTPLALLSRKRSAIRRQPDKESMFTERNHEYTKKDLVNGW